MQFDVMDCVDGLMQFSTQAGGGGEGTIQTCGVQQHKMLDCDLKQQRVLDHDLKQQHVMWNTSQNQVDVNNKKLRKRHLELVIARVMRAQAAAAAQCGERAQCSFF